jgi:hypothetical protein
MAAILAYTALSTIRIEIVGDGAGLGKTENAINIG